MMLGRLFRDPDKDLRGLILSFCEAIPSEQIEDFLDYVDHHETGLALELLGDWIYENDLAVSDEKQIEILRLSEKYDTRLGCFVFLGRQPPYPDLRTAQRPIDDDSFDGLPYKKVRHLAATDRKLLAVRLYRELTGASLDQAVNAVDMMF